MKVIGEQGEWLQISHRIVATSATKQAFVRRLKGATTFMEKWKAPPEYMGEHARARA